MATHSPTLERRTEKLDLRISPTEKARLQAAAAATNRSVSEFVLQSALSDAADALADRREFFLNAEQWAAFQAALDAPPRALPRQREFLSKPGFFDEEAQQ
jgi:uncharacterized protein (DUF1778 family)